MKPKIVKKTTIEAPKDVEPVSDYFIPPGYSSHVTAHRRLDYIKCSDHSYTKRAEIAALIKWLEAQMPTLAE
jgi:hypothetical protein